MESLPGVTLLMQPEQPGMPWEIFVENVRLGLLPKHAIAIDGYVNEPTCWDLSIPMGNINHHAGVDRLGMLATCGQVQMHIEGGLFRRFRNEREEPSAVICMNDCDHDVCLSSFQLKYPHYVKDGRFGIAFNRLVAIESKLDATSGAYKFPPDLPILRKLAWVFEPYADFRASGDIDRRNPKEFLAVIEAVEERIFRHLMGEGGSSPLDLHYKRIGGGPGWHLIGEMGAQGRIKMVADGIEACATVRRRPDGRWSYGLWRLSPFIPFNISRILEFMNDVEGIPEDPWGGSSLTAGGPRVRGSKFSPDEFEGMINSNPQFFTF